MYKVTDTGSIGCIVVGSVDFYITSFAHCSPNCQRNQMGFRPMVFAQSGVIAGAAGIEISERLISEFSRPALVVTHSFDSQFRLAIGIYWLGRRIFGDWHVFRNTVDRSGTAEDELLYADGFHRREQILRTAEIVAIVFKRGMN